VITQLVDQDILVAGSVVDHKDAKRLQGFLFALGAVGLFLWAKVIHFGGGIFGLEFLITSIILFVSGVVMSFISNALYKRTDHGDQEFANWKAFKKFMTDYSVTKNYAIDSVVLWEKYLVYGAALGISAKALAGLPVNFNDSFRHSGLYIVGPNSAGNTFGDMTNLSQDLSTAFSGINSSFGSFGASGVGSSGGRWRRGIACSGRRSPRRRGA
jgi:uncharacterized membrane protein